jgi:hypothetical protein
MVRTEVRPGGVQARTWYLNVPDPITGGLRRLKRAQRFEKKLP